MLPLCRPVLRAGCVSPAQFLRTRFIGLLGSTVNFVYSFGFASSRADDGRSSSINYKLKSTAHMPWKTFMYKALNTFVDDFFAFIIKMPMSPPPSPPDVGFSPSTIAPNTHT